MAKLLVDLTGIERMEFELLRTHFPIEDGEPAPDRESFLMSLTINATMLSIVVKDPAKKDRLGLSDLDVPRRHQRKIAALSTSVVGKLLRYGPDQYAVLMHLVGLSNRLFRENGEEGVTSVFRRLNTPVAIDAQALVARRPIDPRAAEKLTLVDKAAQELLRSAGPALPAPPTGAA